MLRFPCKLFRPEKGLVPISSLIMNALFSYTAQPKRVPLLSSSSSPPIPHLNNQDNFADLEQSSHESRASTGTEDTGGGFLAIEDGPASASSAVSYSNRPSAASEQARRASAAATFGVGPVDGGGQGGAAAAGSARKPSSSRDRRRTSEGR